MSLRDFKKACNKILYEAFDQQYPIYGSETKDGYQRPSFFTELLPQTIRQVSRHISETGLTYKITLLEKTHDESMCMDIVDKVRGAFSPYITVCGGKLPVSSFDFEFIDSGNDVLQITIDFESTRTVQEEIDTTEPAEKIEISANIVEARKDTVIEEGE